MNEQLHSQQKILNESQEQGRTIMSKLLVKTRKKERYIGKVMALHYCRYSNRVLAIKKSH